MESDAVDIRKHVWVDAQGALRKELGRAPSPKVEVEKDQGRTSETAAVRARQGFQVLICSEVGRTKEVGRRWREDRTDAPREGCACDL
jgi:hypothetical protein